ncbi:MAG: 16S rRNA (cytidine(1402)-2'-O)-methyltransferase [Ignavibacteria bacterium RIFOXYB2_FULL_35_12]|nr:MAG: 16S rRNA (cytidine(1402)-2'-O)-methyltransferase [Ignavibacteria bacterium GWA2_36_19]OGU53887.1 MAG: 16S rRNA (cytidine(1402)-2'-O)-methyltransferase [Ignavibacteria bacterium GWC2_35_8]OGU57118.1 MAG: 16S rRNA (cytidine(1402)-2'-O)-methyltransferase [Ignavibacteria bacterium GWF2_35_20]OGU83432.1 MAG: 16S rRNA (cytidine(1402)-2'-O)-methyltransferase [Ignavibacteria bacterium RIFOXYA2_FULL_35_9]OGU88878.1 MAG: 16S rRNA (cytidine(1402)-2'-O)-methyltransferase [Ignavibacteria bacterium R
MIRLLKGAAIILKQFNLTAKLYIVSTPIGNLGDITLRAIEILRSVNFIVCEDTRVTSILLHHLNIKKELYSLNAASEKFKAQKVIERIMQGESCALVTDAGTPGISDPGTRLINLTIKENIDVVSIPGATALIAALSLSGFPSDSFVFEGFLPNKKGRQKNLKQLADEERTVVLYESTYRIEKLIDELAEFMPKRSMVICREITKKFEEVIRGTAKSIQADLNEHILKGEFVVVIASKNLK